MIKAKAIKDQKQKKRRNRTRIERKTRTCLNNVVLVLPTSTLIARPSMFFFCSFNPLCMVYVGARFLQTMDKTNLENNHKQIAQAKTKKNKIRQ